MEYPRYKKLKTSKYYVKLLENDNLHIRETVFGWAMDYNGSLNEYYDSDDFVGCSREEFDEVFKKIVENLNEYN